LRKMAFRKFGRKRVPILYQSSYKLKKYPKPEIYDPQTGQLLYHSEVVQKYRDRAERERAERMKDDFKYLTEQTNVLRRVIPRLHPKRIRNRELTYAQAKRGISDIKIKPPGPTSLESLIGEIFSFLPGGR